MDDLFEGITIMTPAQLEESISKEETEEGQEQKQGETFTIIPVKEVDKEETTTEETTKNDVSTITKSEAVYDALIKEFITDGLLTAKEAEELEKLPKNKETLKKLLEETTDERVRQKEEVWKKSFSGAKKVFLDIEDKFEDTEKAIRAAQTLEFFETIDEDKLKTDTKLLKNLYYDQLKAKNFTHEEALEQIADAEAIGKLQQKGLAALPDLKKQAQKTVEEAETQKKINHEAQEKQQTEMFDKLVATIEEKESFIDGLPLNKVQKDKLKANITTPVHTDEEGKAYTSLMFKQKQNPIEFELLINYYDSIGLFNISKDGKFKPDASKIKAAVKTVAVNELDKVINNTEAREVGKNTSIDQTQMQANIFKVLEAGIKS